MTAPTAVATRATHKYSRGVATTKSHNIIRYAAATAAAEEESRNVGGGLGVAGAVGGGACLVRFFCGGAVLGVRGLRRGLARGGLGCCGRAVQGFDHFVHPVALLFGLRDHLPQCPPEPQRPIADRE